LTEKEKGMQVGWWKKKKTCGPFEERHEIELR